MQYKRSWWITLMVTTTTLIGALLMGFRASPSPQPQRVTDLVARLDALEEENRTQQELLDDLSSRVAILEESGVTNGAISLDDDVEIPEAWVSSDSSDGIVQYRHEPAWELTSDEPGAIDLWLDENRAIFLTWDWSQDLLIDLHNDEEFMRFFEKDLYWSDEALQMKVEKSGPVEILGEDAHYWEIQMDSADRYSSRMLTIFYPCTYRTSCNLVWAVYDPIPNDDEGVEPFDERDWEFINTFAHGLEFLSEGQTTVTGNANLRRCPAVTCEVVGRLVRGEIIHLVAVSEDSYWFQLDSGEWVAAWLVVDAPPDLPMIEGDQDI